jgi:hypothetical protein
MFNRAVTCNRQYFITQQYTPHTRHYNASLEIDAYTDTYTYTHEVTAMQYTRIHDTDVWRCTCIVDRQDACTIIGTGTDTKRL